VRSFLFARPDACHYIVIVGLTALGKDYPTIGVQRVDGALDAFAVGYQALPVRSNRAIRIGENGELKALLLTIPIVGLNRCRVDSQNRGVEGLKLSPGRFQSGQLTVSAGRVILRVEDDHRKPTGQRA
jgi:hypothetical protein